MSAIGLGVLTSEKDRTSFSILRETLLRERRLELIFSGLPDALQDNDADFATVLAKNPVVLAAYVQPQGPPFSREDIPLPLSSVLRKKSDTPPLTDLIPGVSSAAFPLPEFSAVAPVGIVSLTPDADGVIRRLPLLNMIDGNLYATLALRCIMLASGKNTVVMQAGRSGLKSVSIGDETVPVSRDATVLLPYMGPAFTFPHYSAADVLQGEIGPELLMGRIALVGAGAAGMSEVFATPAGRSYPGMEIHATLLNAFLTGRYLSSPWWIKQAQCAAIVLAALASALVFGLARPRVFMAGGGLLIVSILSGCVILFSQGIAFSPSYVLLAVLLNGAILLVARLRQEERQKTMLRNAFSRYVPPNVVRQVTSLKGNIFDGEEREATIMFTDIRDFTTLSERLSPRQVVGLLNRYFTPMTALVHCHEGTLDKFIGDALLAFWNAPLDVADHPRKAVETALAMQETLALLNESLRTSYHVSLHMGAGVHTGRVYVGNMGTSQLLNYTIIGDSVNLASRLERLCSVYGQSLIVSTDTREACGEAFAYQYIDMLTVKGRNQPVTVYTAMRHDEWRQRLEEMAIHEEACVHYIAGDFARAGTMFAKLAKLCPENRLYRVFAERAHFLERNHPFPWEGVWSWTDQSL